jgi:hypothetical protein
MLRYFASLYLWALPFPHKPYYINEIYNCSLSHTVGQGKTRDICLQCRRKLKNLGKYILTCIRLSSHLFRMTLRTACNIRDVTPGTLTATDTCIGYHVTRFEASRNVILRTRYVSTCVGAGCGRGRETKKKQKQSAVAHVIIVSC